MVIILANREEMQAFISNYQNELDSMNQIHSTVQQNNQFSNNPTNITVGPNISNYVDSTTDSGVSMENTSIAREYKKSEQLATVELLANNIDKIIRYPFPFRFKVYSKALELYASTVHVMEILPKSVKNNFGLDMSKTVKALLRTIDKTNNEYDYEKRIKGWKNCHELVNSTSADLVVCLKNNYIKSSKISSLIGQSYELNVCFLKLISVEMSRSALGNNPTEEERKQFSEYMSMIISEKVDGPIALNPANYPPKQSAPPDTKGKNAAAYTQAVLQKFGVETPVNIKTKRISPFANKQEPTIKMSSYAGKIYQQMMTDINRYQNNAIPVLSTYQNSINLMKIDKKEEIAMQQQFNIAAQCIQENKISPVVKDYFHKSRVNKFHGDIASARTAFETRIMNNL